MTFFNKKHMTHRKKWRKSLKKPTKLPSYRLINTTWPERPRRRRSPTLPPPSTQPSTVSAVFDCWPAGSGPGLWQFSWRSEEVRLLDWCRPSKTRTWFPEGFWHGSGRVSCREVAWAGSWCFSGGCGRFDLRGWWSGRGLVCRGWVACSRTRILLVWDRLGRKCSGLPGGRLLGRCRPSLRSWDARQEQLGKN